jgi:hypothetical protein
MTSEFKIPWNELENFVKKENFDFAFFPLNLPSFYRQIKNILLHAGRCVSQSQKSSIKSPDIIYKLIFYQMRSIK